MAENGQIIATFQILKPSEVKSSSSGKSSAGGGSSGKGVWVVTGLGETLFDAVRNASIQTDRKLSATHNNVIVVSEEVARSGIAPVLDFLNRDHETRITAGLFITQGKAKDIINAEHEQEKIPGKAIENMSKVVATTSKLPETNLFTFLKTLSTKSSDPFLPEIEEYEKADGDKTKKLLKLNDTAIFKKDKLVGWFNFIETRGMLWVLGEVKSGVIVIRSPKEENKKVSLEILRASSSIKPEMVDGRLVITVEIKADCSIDEQMSLGVDLTKPENFKQLEEIQTEVIKNEVSAALNKAQKEWKADVFKFGEAIHRKYPNEWQELKKRWPEELPKIAVNVIVEAKLRRVGMKTKSEISEE